jgi:hypothetical protein
MHVVMYEGGGFGAIGRPVRTVLSDTRNYIGLAHVCGVVAKRPISELLQNGRCLCVPDRANARRFTSSLQHALGHAWTTVSHCEP